VFSSTPIFGNHCAMKKKLPIAPVRANVLGTCADHAIWTLTVSPDARARQRNLRNGAIRGISVVWRDESKLAGQVAAAAVGADHAEVRARRSSPSRTAAYSLRVPAAQTPLAHPRRSGIAPGVVIKVETQRVAAMFDVLRQVTISLPEMVRLAGSSRAVMA
jgi:hypothetical protein